MALLRAVAHAPDDISDVLGDVRFVERWSDPAMTRRIVGPHSTRIVRVSRFYLLRAPRVAVDFEPSPLVGGKMYCEAKREWCHEQRIVYVPIFLRERLRPTEFAERLALETAAMERGADEAVEDAALRSIDTVLMEPAVVTFINAEALARLSAEMRAGRRLLGATKAARLSAIKAAVTEELRQKGPDALGREFGHRQLALTAR